MKNERAEDKGAAKNQRAEDKDMQKSKGMSSENERGKAGKDMKAEGREGSKNMKAEGREGQKGNMNAQGRESQTTTQNREGQSGKSTTQTGQTSTQSQTTTGQAGGGAKLSTEQRTKITSVIREQHVQELNNVNFSVSVGTRVPRDVRFHPLPQEVVSIYPEWRGYEFVLVRHQIVVIDPRTFEIVAILEA
jgi:hypothetical protein